MRCKLAAAFVLACVLAPAASAQVQAAKKAEAPLGGVWYGSVELRHHVNTYYDLDGSLARQQPSLHARAQAGAQFYAGMVDAYATLGVYKLPETQQVLQRRPELAVDVYPLKNENVTLLQYNLVQLPFKGMEQDPEADDEMRQGTVYTFGLAPTVKWPFVAGSTRLEIKGGLDGWTRLYSQRQYTKEYDRRSAGSAGDESDEGRLGLTATDEQEPIEDTALHYRAIAMLGASVQPGFVSGLTTEASASYKTEFDPRYERGEDGAVEQRYAADRYSYYRLRASYALSDRVSLMNDFYHFHDGMFAGKRAGDDRRFRNIARITCKL